MTFQQLVAQNPLYATLFSHTFDHPDLGRYVEMVPTAWLIALSNPDVSDTTDLGTWEPDPPQVDYQALFNNILAHGMRDPVIVGVGRVSRRVRLEAGNHRVHVMLQNGILWLPAVAYIGDSAITHLGNGCHEGSQVDLKIGAGSGLLGPYPIKEYRRLSDTLVAMPTLHG